MPSLLLSQLKFPRAATMVPMASTLKGRWTRCASPFQDRPHVGEPRGARSGLAGLPCSGESKVAASSAWGMTVYGALLPFHAFGSITARRWTVLEPCELVLLAVAPAVLFELVRHHRSLLGSWIVRGVLLLALVGVLAELLAPRASRLVILREGLAVLAVGGVACAVLAGRARQLMAGVLVGGIVALSISAVGYALALSTSSRLARAFVFASEHPLFPRLPRMTGTLGRHAVWLGEYCLMLLAVALAADERVGSRCMRISARVAAVVGLVASVSFAWLGGLVLAIGGWRRSRRGARASSRVFGSVLLLLAFVYSAGVFYMLVGAPIDPAAHAGTRRCRELDGAHHVLRRGPARGDCQAVLGAEPYPHRLTLYALAHQTAGQRFAQHPAFGGGSSGYGAFARAHASQVYALGPIGYYQAPVGLIASTLAYTGLAGAAALLMTLYGVWRSRLFRGSERRRAGQWIFYGTLALLLCATQTDFELRGPLWVLLGLLVGFSVQEHAAVAAPTTGE